jgi:thioesterase domain-containing protein/acyl carrier protein
MIPAAFVTLEALPLTVQGKLDRRSLPAPPGDRPGWSAGYVAPRDEHERIVADVWEKLLGVSPVGIADNFFELGGHSMLAVRMVAEIERRTGRRLPLASLFHQATVEHLARMLREPEVCPPETSLVPLQPIGSGRPMFFIHPAGGTVFCYRLLAEHLGTDRPVYGIQAVGVDGGRAPQEVAEEMAAHYVAAVRSVQPHGPYFLGGWSLGGNLAFEMSRQLVEQGERVGLLALLDAAALAPEKVFREEDFLPLIGELFPSGDDLSIESLRAMAPEQHVEYFIQRAAQAGIVLGNMDPSLGGHVFEVFKSNLKAMMDYRPQPYPGKVTLLFAEEKPQFIEVARDPQLGWGMYAQGGVEVIRIPGDHIHMVQEPNVRVVAERIRQSLAAAEIDG